MAARKEAKNTVKTPRISRLGGKDQKRMHLAPTPQQDSLDGAHYLVTDDAVWREARPDSPRKGLSLGPPDQLQVRKHGLLPIRAC